MQGTTNNLQGITNNKIIKAIRVLTYLSTYIYTNLVRCCKYLDSMVSTIDK